MKDSGLFENSEKDTQSIIQFYYCSSLARRKSIEFESEVSFFADSDSYLSYNFLKGFNYRIQGKFQFAENSYLKVLERNPKVCCEKLVIPRDIIEYLEFRKKIIQSDKMCSADEELMAEEFSLWKIWYFKLGSSRIGYI